MKGGPPWEPEEQQAIRVEHACRGISSQQTKPASSRAEVDYQAQKEKEDEKSQADKRDPTRATPIQQGPQAVGARHSYRSVSSPPNAGVPNTRVGSRDQQPLHPLRFSETHPRVPPPPPSRRGHLPFHPVAQDALLLEAAPPPGALRMENSHTARRFCLGTAPPPSTRRARPLYAWAPTSASAATNW